MPEPWAPRDVSLTTDKPRVDQMNGNEWARVASSMSRPLIKLLEVVRSGVGSLAQPLLIILNAHAQGRARLIRAGYDHQLKMLRLEHRRTLEAGSPTPVPEADLVTDTPQRIALDARAVEELLDQTGRSNWQLLASSKPSSKQSVARTSSRLRPRQQTSSLRTFPISRWMQTGSLGSFHMRRIFLRNNFSICGARC